MRDRASGECSAAQHGTPPTSCGQEEDDSAESSSVRTQLSKSPRAALCGLPREQAKPAWLELGVPRRAETVDHGAHGCPTR